MCVQRSVKLDLAIQGRIAASCLRPVGNGAEAHVLPPVLVGGEEVILAEESALVIADLRQIAKIGAKTSGDMTHVQVDVVIVSRAGKVEAPDVAADTSWRDAEGSCH